MKHLTIEEEFNKRVDMYLNKYPLLTREEITHLLNSDLVSYALELSVRIKQLERNNPHDRIN